MEKVTLNPQTPTEEAVATAKKKTVLKDPRGRSITVCRPNMLCQFRLVDLVGPETAKNQVYLNMAMVVFWVTDIDGEPVFEPATRLELEAALTRLDEDGYDTVMGHIMSQPDTVVTKAAVGNAPGTPSSANE